jgi:hypothetical protein
MLERRLEQASGRLDQVEAGKLGCETPAQPLAEWAIGRELREISIQRKGSDRPDDDAVRRQQARDEAVPHRSGDLGGIRRSGEAA